MTLTSVLHDCHECRHEGACKGRQDIEEQKRFGFNYKDLFAHTYFICFFQEPDEDGWYPGPPGNPAITHPDYTKIRHRIRDVFPRNVVSQEAGVGAPPTPPLDGDGADGAATLDEGEGAGVDDQELEGASVDEQGLVAAVGEGAAAVDEQGHVTAVGEGAESVDEQGHVTAVGEGAESAVDEQGHVAGVGEGAESAVDEQGHVAVGEGAESVGAPEEAAGTAKPAMKTKHLPTGQHAISKRMKDPHACSMHA